MGNDTLQTAKKFVRDFHEKFDGADDSQLVEVLAAHTSPNYSWRGVHPFNELAGADAAVANFWSGLRTSLKSMQRREDVFMAGENSLDPERSVWVASMGYHMGLFDRDWLGIPATRKLAFLRYAEFHRVEQGRIEESALFCDLIGLMQQAGCYPLPPPTGANFIYPGPRTHDGVLLQAQPQEESDKTLALVNQMIEDLNELNASGIDRCPPATLERTWHDDMVWYGPSGIGATYTIPRYQEQHQNPFREHLKDKTFNGHVTRFAEGHYAGFFGWPNLTNTPTGGFLGLPGNDARADMRVVDIYRRAGDKLAENWVFIDLLHWLSMQGLDVLGRLKEGAVTAIE